MQHVVVFWVGRLLQVVSFVLRTVQRPVVFE